MQLLALPQGGRPADIRSFFDYSQSRGITTKAFAAIKIFNYDCNEMSKGLERIKDEFSVIRLEQGIDATGQFSFLGAVLVGVLAIALSRRPVEERTPFEQGLIYLASIAAISLVTIGGRTFNSTIAQHDFNMIRLDECTRFIAETSNPLSEKDNNLLEIYTEPEQLGKNGNTLFMAGTPVVSAGSNHCSVIAVQHVCLMQIVALNPESIQLQGKNYAQLTNKEKAIVATLLLNLYNESTSRIDSPRMITYSSAGKESMTLSEYARDFSVSRNILPDCFKTKNPHNKFLQYSALCSKVHYNKESLTQNRLHDHDFGPALMRMKK